jgi:hypothetical protein
LLELVGGKREINQKGLLLIGYFETINMIKERIQEEVRRLSKPVLGFGAPPGGESFEQNLADNNLTPEQMVGVLGDVGRELARIHSTGGEGFGWINPLRAVVTRKFVARYESWDQFLIAFFDEQTAVMDEIFARERETGQYHTSMSDENRELLKYLHGQRPAVRDIYVRKQALLSGVDSQLLHGNVHIGSVFVDPYGKCIGLSDFTQMLLGDPIDDLAYFSVMPEGERLLPALQEGWKDATEDMDIEEKLHLYRLWQSFRKMCTRYAKHRYLDDYPEPLRIGLEELRHFGV